MVFKMLKFYNISRFTHIKIYVFDSLPMSLVYSESHINCMGIVLLDRPARNAIICF